MSLTGLIIIVLMVLPCVDDICDDGDGGDDDADVFMTTPLEINWKRKNQKFVSCF